METIRKAAKYGAIAIVALLGLVILLYLLGVLGVPSVTDVENRFGEVNRSTSTVLTDLGVHNPNPIGIRLGGSVVDYTVSMNDVNMAEGSHAGISVPSGDSRLNLTTYLRNEQIPEWWYTHVSNGEVTEVLIDADLTVGLLFGGTFDFETNETVETDILGGFNSSETRPIDVDAPVISNPALYMNSTAGWYGDNVTRSRTPIETAFTVYNPKEWPYAVSEIGYEIRMNDVAVGEGTTDREYTIPAGVTRTLRATTVIRNERLDEWWVSHLQNDQVTNLTVDFYVVIDPETGTLVDEQIDPIRVDVDSFDYTTTIETDIYGTKANESGGAGDGSTGTGGGSGDASGSDGDASGSDGDTSGSDGDTSGSDGSADGSFGTATTTGTATPTPTPTPTTTTDDGSLLSALRA
jgi:LEA14-like dessication related protein